MAVAPFTWLTLFEMMRERKPNPSCHPTEKFYHAPIFCKIYTHPRLVPPLQHSRSSVLGILSSLDIMGECCELPSDFHDDEVGLHGKENNNLELRLGPTGESQHNPRTRTCNASAVGWPPVASFRKNVADSCLRKRQADAELGSLSRKEENEKDYANTSEHVFIKVYMEGYPIGRKIDLRAYDGYEKLSFAISELFRCLLADYESCAENDAHTPQEEHTLVYEDNEGDVILVGDVPWNVFVSTTKKLRVLKRRAHMWKMKDDAMSW